MTTDAILERVDRLSYLNFNVLEEDLIFPGWLALGGIKLGGGPVLPRWSRRVFVHGYSSVGHGVD